MSREALQDFLRAVEHHQGLRRDATQCSDDDQLLALARRHGFNVIQRDLCDDARELAITRWVETSRIQRSFQSPPFQSPKT
ncbi:Nif11-like leader peptide family natural product precursor [Parasynechococcus sp.]|uniref:Nif11-like leader peptide family natural product precursor n=1 Tax=Parasynechococcus sp. TaxID=3101203 RepID=UPI003704619C